MSICQRMSKIHAQTPCFSVANGYNAVMDVKDWRAEPDSNRRPLPPQGSALSTELPAPDAIDPSLLPSEWDSGPRLEPLWFWSRVQVGAADECWLWTGAVQSKGYGALSINGVPELAHRFAFWLADGWFPLVVMHKCDVRRCCNRAHLLPGTIALNNADMKAKGRYNLRGLKQYASNATAMARARS